MSLNKRPLSKFALLGKKDNFCSDSSANFEGISKDMTEKFDVEDDKKCCFNEQMDLRKRSKGLFIAFEGGEGAGKTTVVKEIARTLSARGIEVVKTHEPGTTPLGKEIREILLQNKKGFSISSKAELLLFLAARAQNIEEVIRPALARGAWVLCDRFNDSTLAYQGWARGLGIKDVEKFCHWVCEDTLPDITFFLKVDPSIGLQRAGSVGEFDRIEAEANDFHRRVQEGFQKIQKLHPDHFTWIDAGQSKTKVVADVWNFLSQKIES